MSDTSITVIYHAMSLTTVFNYLICKNKFNGKTLLYNCHHTEKYYIHCIPII